MDVVILVGGFWSLFLLLCAYTAQKHAAAAARELRAIREHLEAVAPKPAAPASDAERFKYAT